MEIRYDKEADAMYLTFREGEFARNRKVDDDTIVDFDAEGNILGIELLRVSERIPTESLSHLHVQGLVVET